MTGYWFAGAASVGTPSLLEVVYGLFYWVGREKNDPYADEGEGFDNNDPVEVRYHNDLVRVLGVPLHERFSAVTWDGDEL